MEGADEERWSTRSFSREEAPLFELFSRHEFSNFSRCLKGVFPFLKIVFSFFLWSCMLPFSFERGHFFRRCSCKLVT